MPKPKFYTVWEGHTPGVYDNWNDANRQVKGFPQAKYKSFGSRAEAEAALRGNYWEFVDKKSPTQKPKTPPAAAITVPSVCVDAACSGNPGNLEYRGVDTETRTQLFHQGPFPEGTNNVGEFLAIVHALAMLAKEGKPRMPIYTDSRNAMLWIKAKKCRTKLDRTSRNEKLFELIGRAERWLAANPVTNPILKWETAVWGEIPADFGRK
ncbi:MAG: ribonuclease H family protein [Saprospiraceae bacterium]|nr:ribonuclease H family protein [Saprospiraceae bacterium]